MKPGQRIVSSWSGGKDSCLALFRAIQAGAQHVALLTMLQEDGRRSRSHGLALEVLQAQASAMNIPGILCPNAVGDDTSGVIPL